MAATDARMELVITSKRRVHEQEDDAASAKRHRPHEQQQPRHRDQDDEQQRQDHPTTSAPESAAAAGEAMVAALDAVVNKPRKTRELVYKDSTRVLIGPGFTVSEVLFGEEAASARITASIMKSTVAFLRSQPALVEFEAALRKATEVVEVVDIDKKMEAAAQAETAEQHSITAHLTSKHELAPFCEALQVFNGRVDGFAVEGVDTTLTRAVWRPPGLVDVSFTGSLSISWAVGPGSGSASLAFSTASAANVFLSCYLAGKFEGLNGTKISLVGYIDDLRMTATEKKKEQQKRRRCPYLPPLKTVVFQCSSEKITQVFDEAKIDAMDPSAVLALRFEARIHSGLPAQIDTVALTERLYPHDVEVVLGRKYDASAARTMDAASHLFAPLADSVAHDEKLHFAVSAEQASVTVHFPTMERLDAAKQKATESVLWSTMERQFGEMPRLSVVYKWRASLAEDMRACFRTELFHVREYARLHGVSWEEADARENGTHTVLTLEGGCPDTVKRVVAKIEAMMTWERFFDPALPAPPMSISEWKTFIRKLKAKKHSSGSGNNSATACIRDHQRRRELYVYGTKEKRREKVHEIKEEYLSHRLVPQGNYCVCETPSDPAKYVAFTACTHKVCLSCMRLCLTPSTPLPLRCPVEGCGQEMDVNDVMTIATNVDELVELAMRDYVAKHANKYALCPQPGCKQILQRPKLGQLTEEETPRLHFSACESCRGSYCLACSDAVGCAVDAHDGSSCDDAIVACALNVDDHVHVIRNKILTLTCPHCTCAFVDFEGCLSVACNNITCARQFCACCLNFSDPNAKVTAEHVRRCSKNVALGDGTGDAAKLQAIHRNHRQRQIKKYLDSHVQSRYVRYLVLERLGEDLSALGLTTID